MDLCERACIGGSSPPMGRLLSMSSQSLSSQPLWCKGGLIIANTNTQSLSQRPPSLVLQGRQYLQRLQYIEMFNDFLLFIHHSWCCRSDCKGKKTTKRSTWFDRLAFLLFPQKKKVVNKSNWDPITHQKSLPLPPQHVTVTLQNVKT